MLSSAQQSTNPDEGPESIEPTAQSVVNFRVERLGGLTVAVPAKQTRYLVPLLIVAAIVFGPPLVILCSSTPRSGAVMFATTLAQLIALVSMYIVDRRRSP